MPSVTRLGDSGTGHGTWPPRSNAGAVSTVVVDGKPVHTVGDGWASHCSTVPKHPCHGSSAAGGSGTTYAEGKAVCRVGDPVACGSSMASGSSTTFAN